MIRGLLLALILGLLPVAAAAQTATLRAGEHRGFTRLVLTLPAPSNWRFGRTPDGYELRFEGASPRLDLSAVFDRIPRDRLMSVWSDPATGALRLGLRCACHGVAFAARPAVVVIDLRDGPPPPGSGFERAIDAPDGPALPPLNARATPRPRARPRDFAPPAASPPAYDWLATPALTPPPVPAPVAPMLPDAAAADLRAAIVDQIARAASSGIVDPAVRIARPAAPPVGGDAAATADAGAAAPVMDTGPGLIATPEGSSPAPTAGDGRDCVPDARLAFLASPDRGAGPVWDALPPEPDDIDAAAALRLAEAFLARGFGAEATAIAAAFDLPDADRALIAALAAAVDDTPAPAASPLAGMQTCDGDAALWALLTMAPPTPGAPVAGTAVQRTILALPPALRATVGPRAAERLLAAGQDSAARAVRDAVARATDDPAAVGLVDAGLALREGARERAEAGLRTLSDTSGEAGARALAQLADSMVDRGAVPDEATALALAAAERTARGTAAGIEIARALARTAAARGDFAEAFAVAAGAGGDAAGAVWAILAARGGDEAVIRHAVGDGPQPALPIGTRRAVADRLLDLGLADTAAVWLLPPAAPVPPPEDAIRLARSALLRGDARDALRVLAGAADAEAAALRAAARDRLGDAAGAAEAWLAAGQPDRAARTAWRARDWALAAAIGADHAGALPEAAGDLIAAVAPPPAGSGAAPGDVAGQPGLQAPAAAAPVTLAGAAERLAEAERLRGRIDELFAAFPAP